MVGFQFVLPAVALERNPNAQVNGAFGRFMLEYEACPVLIVDTSRVDLAHREDEVEDVLRALARLRGGKSIYAPASLHEA